MSPFTIEKKIWRQKLEVSVDEDSSYANDRWTNRDLVPMPKDRRTYTAWSFVIYWAVSGMNISAYSTGSSLLAYGLTAQQAMCCVVVGGVISGILSVVSGLPGAFHHIGFTVASRFSWGMKGAYIPIGLRVFTSLWWFGIQAYWGGQAVSVMLGGLVGDKWYNLANTIPLSANITTKDLIGTLLWYLAYIPLVLVAPERLQRPFIVCSSAFGLTLIGLLAWSVSTQGGGGPLFHTVNTSTSTPYSMMLGITSILSSWGSGTIGQSDWTRYSKTKYAPTFAQLLVAPVMITVTALVGVVVTSASSEILGTLYWSPIGLLGAIQGHYNSSSAVRAAVFFGGLGCTLAQLAINVVLNSVSTGMDMAGFAPRYINIRRGAYILAILALCTTPWNVVSSAATFLAVISGLGIFIAPMTGVMLADYLLIRKRVLKMEDLYVGDNLSIYWFYKGYHWRAALATVLGSLPMCPGFIMTLINSAASNGWVKLFNISFLVGIVLGFAIFATVGLVWPPPHLGIGLTYHDESLFASNDAVAQDARSSDSNADDEEKGVEGSKVDASVSIVPTLA